MSLTIGLRMARTNVRRMNSLKLSENNLEIYKCPSKIVYNANRG